MNPAPQIDPKVTRRTLSIVGGMFLLGFVLSVFWMSKEIYRVSRIQRISPDESAAQRMVPTLTQTNTPP